jgi:hypothetical protein
MHTTGDTRPLIARLLVRRFEYRHPLAWGGLLFASGLWLIVLGAILCFAGYWWGTLLFVLGPLLIWGAHVLLSDTGN